MRPHDGAIDGHAGEGRRRPIPSDGQELPPDDGPREEAGDRDGNKDRDHQDVRDGPDGALAKAREGGW